MGFRRVVVVVVLGVVGCSNPRDEPFPATDRPPQARYAKAVERLSAEERELLTGYFKRHSMEMGFGGARTIGDAIDEQRRWLAGAPAREAANEEARRQLAAVVEVRIVGRMRDTTKDGKPVRLELAIRNLGPKPIRKVQGTITIDADPDPRVFPLSLEVDAPAGSTVRTTGWLTTKMPGMHPVGETLGLRPLDEVPMGWTATSVTFADFSRVFVE